MSQLQLNEPQVNYKDFYGRNVGQMPQLIAEGRTPLSVSGLMKRRLETQNASKWVRDAWMHSYFDTGDGVAYHPDGRIKIVPDAKPLREMNSESNLVNGALTLPDGMYEKLDGQEFTRKDIQKYVGDAISSKEAKSNPLWQALARDPKLLNEYVDLIFDQAKQQFSYDKNMEVYVKDASDVSKDAATMRLWVVGGLWDMSNAGGGGGLDGSLGRLVGIASELASESLREPRMSQAQAAKSVVPNSTLETRVAAALNLGQAFEHNGTLYVPVADKSVVRQ